MFNTFQYNTVQFGASSTPVALTGEDFDQLEFDGYSLQTTNIISQRVLADSPPTRDLRSFNAPLEDGGALIGDNFTERRIRVFGIIKADTAALLESGMDEMKRRLSKREGNFDYTLNTTTKRCKATLRNTDRMFEGRQTYHVTFCPFELEFVTFEPYWYGLEYTSLAVLTETTLARNVEIENTGEWQARSVYIFTINAATGITKLNITSNTNADEIEIEPSGGFSAGDVVIIDGETQSVTINGTEVEYDGVFPLLDYGPNSLAVTWTGTSLTYDLTIKYKETYL